MQYGRFSTSWQQWNMGQQQRGKTHNTLTCFRRQWWGSNITVELQPSKQRQFGNTQCKNTIPDRKPMCLVCSHVYRKPRPHMTLMFVGVKKRYLTILWFSKSLTVVIWLVATSTRSTSKFLWHHSIARWLFGDKQAPESHEIMKLEVSKSIFFFS